MHQAVESLQLPRTADLVRRQERNRATDECEDCLQTIDRIVEQLSLDSEEMALEGLAAPQ